MYLHRVQQREVCSLSQLILVMFGEGVHCLVGGGQWMVHREHTSHQLSASRFE